MSKRSTALKPKTKSVKATALAGRRRSRAARPAAEMPPEAVEFMRKFQEWLQSFETPDKRRAYIENLCQRIAGEFKSEKIILFGSHAYGQPTPDSDVDLLVVMPFEGEPVNQAIKISRQLNLVLPLDLLVRTREQVAERVAMEDYFIREILERGKVMYEAHHG